MDLTKLSLKPDTIIKFQVGSTKIGGHLFMIRFIDATTLDSAVATVYSCIFDTLRPPLEIMYQMTPHISNTIINEYHRQNKVEGDEFLLPPDGDKD